MKLVVVDSANLVRYSVLLTVGQIGESSFILQDEFDQPVVFRQLDIVYDRHYESCHVKVVWNDGVVCTLKVIGVEDGQVSSS